MTTGEKIQQLRKEHGMSQEQLAEKITVSRQAVSKWELGESLPDTDNVVQLSDIFDVSTDYLLRDTVKQETDVPIVQATSRKITNSYRKRIIIICAVVLVCVLVSIITRSTLVMFFPFAILFGYIIYLVVKVLQNLAK